MLKMAQTSCSCFCMHKMGWLIIALNPLNVSKPLRCWQPIAFTKPSQHSLPK